MQTVVGEFKLSHPWFCLVTPEGPAGVAVWAVGGESVWNLLRSHFQIINPPQKIGPIKLGAQFLGRLIGKNFVSDEVLMVSTTINRVPVLEIHGHGGSLISQMQRELFVEAGLEEVPASWIGNLVVKTKILAHLEEVILKGQTLRAIRCLLNQSRVLPKFLAYLAHEIKEENEEKVVLLCDSLARCSIRGLHWVNPFKVTVLGPPNVGKSSLLNGLIGAKRVVVSDIPGTTIDPVQVLTAMDGWPVEFCDTAGLRDTSDYLEKMGVKLAGKKAEGSNLILWLSEARSGPSEAIIPSDFNNQKIPLITVRTKLDLLGDLNPETPLNTVFVSSKNRVGFDKLQEMIIKKLLAGLPDGEDNPTACTGELIKSVCEMRELAKAGRFHEALEKVNYWLDN